MSALVFVRTSGSIDSDLLFEEKPEIWMFGDRRGFDDFLKAIRRAIDQEQNSRVAAVEKNKAGMLLNVLCPKKNGCKAKLRFGERFVFKDQIPRMEFVIYGNVAGYQYLVDAISGFVAESEPDFSEHLHFVDWSDPVIRRGSIGLNIRAPLERWTEEHFGQYSALLELDRQTIPSSLSYRFDEKEPYLDIDPSDKEFLKLWDV